MNSHQYSDMANLSGLNIVIFSQIESAVVDWPILFWSLNVTNVNVNVEIIVCSTGETFSPQIQNVWVFSNHKKHPLQYQLFTVLGIFAFNETLRYT